MPGEKTLIDIENGGQAVAGVIAKAKELKGLAQHFRRAKKIYAAGCGSSYWLSYLCACFLRGRGFDARAVFASEFYLADYPLAGNDLLIAFSQSGQTTEAIRAAEKAKASHAGTLVIVNRSGSELAKIADHHFLTPAGDEQIMATKSFDAGLAAAYIFASALGGTDYGEIKNLPAFHEKAARLDLAAAVNLLSTASRAYALGSGADFGAAGETAVKLGEAARIQTTALPALEISHGPKANVAGVPVIVAGLDIACRKIYENIITEIKKAGALVIAFSPLNLPYRPADVNLELPGTGEIAAFSAIKLAQRLALETALAKGLDPDKPAGLAKAVIRKEL